jgi:hypothetical protein
LSSLSASTFQLEFLSVKMEDSTVRKASDVLIELEHKVDTLLKLCQMFDSNIKLVLHRQNELTKALEQAISGETPENAEVALTADEPIIQIESEPKGQRRTSRTSALEVEKGTTAVPVSQMITDQNGKILYMADVEVLDANKDLVLKTKSNAAGKWQAALMPGDYFVNVLKKGKKNMTLMQAFKVTQSSSTIVLDTIVLKS